MKKLAFLALTVAALAFPTLASAHDFHGGWHGPHGHAHFAVPFPLPVPVPVGFFHPAYVAPPAYVAAPAYAYPAPYPPAYAAPAPVYYGPRVVAPAPVFAIRTPHVAVSIGGWLPF
ncbi:MAG TPA: hypothetical protein VMR50_00165 [Myxococcota bacterium]|nr:hypothetical protein [Myxococcota bacterium]